MATSESAAATPLGIRSFWIQNFRTFRNRTVVPLENDITVFHGDTGSGKSTALLALDRLLRSLVILLPARPDGKLFPWTETWERGEPLITERDRPLATEPTVFGAQLTDESGTSVEVHFVPSGQQVHGKILWGGEYGRLIAERATRLAEAEASLTAARTAAAQAAQRPSQPVGPLPQQARTLAQQATIRAKNLVKQLSTTVEKEKAAADAEAQAAGQRLNQLLFPFGSNSRAFGVLDARRRPRWIAASESGGSKLAPALVNELYRLRTSRTASDRDRWRAFTEMLTGFPTLRGATVSVEAGSPAQLVVEHPGRIVLDLDDLSSGEQELASLTATLLLSKAGIVAIEEPEMGLDPRTQELLRVLCGQQRSAGFVHQMIFESHAVSFDGARVVRFHRDANGWTQVESAPSSGTDETAQEAKSKGAEEVFVTPQGYTRLPEPMLREVAVGAAGARVWFLRGQETWEAWPEAKLEALLAGKQ